MNTPQRDNNPGDLEFHDQPGATADGRFACFKDAWNGFATLHAQIKLDQDRGLTFDKFIGKYAPANENDTEKYKQFVCGGLGVLPTDLLSKRSRFAIAGMIAQMEGFFAQEA